MKIHYPKGISISIELINGSVVGITTTPEKTRILRVSEEDCQILSDIDWIPFRGTTSPKDYSSPRDFMIACFVDGLALLKEDLIGHAEEFELMTAYTEDLLDGKSVTWFPSDGYIGKDPYEYLSLSKFKDGKDWVEYIDEENSEEIDHSTWIYSSQDILDREIFFE